MHIIKAKLSSCYCNLPDNINHLGTNLGLQKSIINHLLLHCMSVSVKIELHNRLYNKSASVGKLKAALYALVG